MQNSNFLATTQQWTMTKCQLSKVLWTKTKRRLPKVLPKVPEAWTEMELNLPPVPKILAMGTLMRVVMVRLCAHASEGALAGGCEHASAAARDVRHDDAQHAEQRDDRRLVVGAAVDAGGG